MTMKKRPLPPSSHRTASAAAATALLLLALQPAATQSFEPENGARKKPHFETQCLPLLSKAIGYDANGSGGLDLVEFTNLWHGLDKADGSASAGGGDGGTAALPSDAAWTYGTLKCQCAETFGAEFSCCDDTGSDDDDSNEDAQSMVPGGEGGGRWYEVKLVGFDKHFSEGGRGEGPTPLEKEYHKEFCKDMYDVMKWEGVTFVAEDEAAASSATTTSTTTTSSTTTATAATEAPTTAPTEEATTASTTASTAEEPITSSSAAPTEPAATTTTPKPESTNATTSANTTTTTSTTTTTTTSTTTTTPITTTTTTSEEEEPTPLAPITLKFLGSTNGQVLADDVDWVEVNHAFWTVALDVLKGLSNSNSEDEEVRSLRRQLILEFAQDINVYFESVVLDVDDVGCPDELVYAGENESCLEFTYTLTPIPGGPLTEPLAREFADSFYAAANDDGDLSAALFDKYPETDIVGFGSPGSGIRPVATDAAAPVANVIIGESQGADNSSKSAAAAAAGFPIGGIIGIALAASVLVLLVVATVVKKKRQRNKQKAIELNNSNLSEDLEAEEVNDDANAVEDWLDEADIEDEYAEYSERRTVQTKNSTASSSLAAMGVMSSVATRLSTGDTEVMVVEKQPWSRREPDV